MAAHAPAVLQQLRVFVAAPGGVEDERRKVRGIAEELNVPLRRNGWEIVVLGWEDRGPTGGRAQADINEDVQRCDVFVGILYDRWGTPTGDSSSGFAEEWELARDRHQAGGRPDLWLFFKQLTEEIAEGAAANPQVTSVLKFRHEVERDEIAFHKAFDDLDDFEGLILRRMLVEIFDRSGLTRTDLGVATIDWAAAYDDDPVVLLPDGRNRVALADDLEHSAPAEAASLLVSLADDADERGFISTAEHLRVRACRVWIKAGDTAVAVALLRRILGVHLWELRFQEIDMLLRELDKDLPPDLAAEVRGWRACLDAPDEPVKTAEALGEAMSAQHGFPLDGDTLAHWQAVRWRCLLDADDPQAVTADAFGVDAKQGGVHLELAMLRADAFRAVHDDQADTAWRQLRLLGVHAATEDPEVAAWIATRTALDAIAREDLDTAEVAYADAATRWTKVTGASGNAAMAFFSAQAAGQLRRDWSFRAWGWRSIAAAQLGRATGLVARAEELERNALSARLNDHHGKAVSMLRAAVWCHLRAGFINGVMRARAQLAAAYAAAGDEVGAVGLHCEIGQCREAEQIAQASVDGRAVAARMAEAFPTWAAEARFAALAQVGSHASPKVAAELALEVIAATEPNPDRKFDNAPTQAAQALCALALAVEDAQVLQSVVAKFQQFAGEKHYSFAQAGRFGLRALHDIGVIDAADVLISCFVSDDRPDEPDPVWVAEHLDTPARMQHVRRAAFAGHRRALIALVNAEIPAVDAQLRAGCAAATRRFLEDDIGMTPDGSGMWGLMALDVQGAIAAATGDDALQSAVVERLLIYGAASRWPMVNRVSAIRGLRPLAEAVNHENLLDALRPLARPEMDLDDATDPYLRDTWVRRGDLEAAAVDVCAGIAPNGPPEWLDEAVSEARFDERTPLRESACRAAGERPAWFDAESLRHALHDENARVPIAALHAWRKQGPALPLAELRRLVADTNTGVRLALIRLLETAPNSDAVAALRNDPDAYVRGIAHKRLGPQ